ncbi:MAG TPA: pyruvate, phosphate dikinase, partial [Planctomycetes bacterium]|nr:pyruvate, phosphate dikinase [Planctomycetota bacterium]
MPKPKSRDRNILGGKGAGLVDMTELSLPVPPGFTLTTAVCANWDKSRQLSPEIQSAVRRAMSQMGKAMGREFNGKEEPLLVSVRSGARVSMPGMMDTVLNLGLSPEKVETLAEVTGNPRFAWDSYRRFIAMFGDVVLGLCTADHSPFEDILEKEKERAKVNLDHQLNAAALRRVAQSSRNWIKQKTGHPFPDDPWEQLWAAIAAVFDSWGNPRAAAYRRLNGIPDDWGTAVNIQAMVFGNLGEDSGTGVGFTRNPATGAKGMYGEFLMNAQGEDVVAGTRTPHPLEEMQADSPETYAELTKISKDLENAFRDMQDFEFTIERGRLFMLQTRVGKRTGTAAVRIATDMVREKRIKSEEALLRIDPEGLVQLLGPVFKGSSKEEAMAQGRYLARGLPAGPGAAAGRIVFKAEDAVEEAQKGPVILVREETSPEDILGMAASVGILTSRGGMTSHAALV